MNRIVLLISVLTACLMVGCASPMNPPDKVLREGIEWCESWMPSVNSQDKPHVLLVGDSITKAYYTVAASNLSGVAYCAKFTTSACVADPVFHKQLETMFDHYDYAVIHFNNGLHGFGYTEEEYRAGYEKALSYIRSQAPSAKIVLALSTPLQSTSSLNSMNPRLDMRNQIVRELAGTIGVEINDLYSISKDRPELYRDPFHYKPETSALQGAQVATVIGEILAADKEEL